MLTIGVNTKFEIQVYISHAETDKLISILDEYKFKYTYYRYKTEYSSFNFPVNLGSCSDMFNFVTKHVTILTDKD